MNPVALQTALYEKLAGDAVLTAELSDAWSDDDGAVDAIFSDVPQENAEDGAFYPFVSFYISTINPFDDKDDNGMNTLVDISVWTRSGDYIHGNQIATRIHTLLHEQPLTIAGQNHVFTTMESVTPNLDPDGETRRVLSLYRVISQDN